MGSWQALLEFRVLGVSKPSAVSSLRSQHEVEGPSLPAHSLPSQAWQGLLAQGQHGEPECAVPHTVSEAGYMQIFIQSCFTWLWCCWATCTMLPLVLWPAAQTSEEASSSLSSLWESVLGPTLPWRWRFGAPGWVRCSCAVPRCP